MTKLQYYVFAGCFLFVVLGLPAVGLYLGVEQNNSWWFWLCLPIVLILS